MTTNVLPASNVVNVTIANQPSALTEKNVNSLLLLTTETPSNAEPYGIYVGASQAAGIYGTNSITAQMASAVFSQVPNVLSGGGRLVIAPMIGATSATHGTSTTADISANLNSIKTVTNGNLKVTVNGTDYNLSNLSFAGALTWSDVAAIVQAAIVDAKVEATANGLKFTSKKVGSSSTVALATYAGGGTDLAWAGYFNAAGATNVAGTNSTGETVLAAIARVAPLVGFVPVMTNLKLEDAAIATIAAGVQALDNMFIHHCSSTQDVGGIATTVSQATETKTRLVLHTDSQTTANLFKAAYAARLCSTDFTGSRTASTMNLKPLSGVSPDTGISQTVYQNALTAGIDLYVSYDGVPSVVSAGGNDYSDNIYADLALKFALTTAGFNYLRTTNTKIPQTESGMTGLKDAYGRVCEQFVRNGCIAGGAWTSGDTFGDPEIFTENVANKGYYIWSTPIALQSISDRAARKAPLVQIAIKRAGAIHHSDVLVLVNA